MFHSFGATQIHFAPLQGYTTRPYRTAFDRCFGKVDRYYTPYVCLTNDGEFDGVQDLIPFQESLVPQILPGNMNELKLLADVVQQLSYRTLNINMGCPYPMVTGKGRGAALMQKPDLVASMIQYVSATTSLKLSLKMRSGLENPNEIVALLNRIPLEQLTGIIIHPRTAKQLYKGEADFSVVKKCKVFHPNIPIIYNGDINSYAKFVELRNEIGDLDGWMLGRGLLHNPFLAEQIKTNRCELPDHYGDQLLRFMHELVNKIVCVSKNEGHALNQCKIQINYLLEGFPIFRKTRKKISKSKTIEELSNIIDAENGFVSG